MATQKTYLATQCEWLFKVIQGCCFLHQTTSYEQSIETLLLSYTYSKTQQLIGQKSPSFAIPLAGVNPFKCLDNLVDQGKSKSQTNVITGKNLPFISGHKPDFLDAQSKMSKHCYAYKIQHHKNEL